MTYKQTNVYSDMWEVMSSLCCVLGQSLVYTNIRDIKKKEEKTVGGGREVEGEGMGMGRITANQKSSISHIVQTCSMLCAYNSSSVLAMYIVVRNRYMHAHHVHIPSF